VSVLSAEGVVLYASPAFLRAFGYAPEELAGTPAFERVHPEDHAVVQAALADVSRKPGEQVAVRLRYRNKAGDWCRMEASAWNLLDDPAVRGIVVNARDVTQHEALEAQLQQAQKLEAVGRLAGGVAHDFNNLLTAILSNAELVLGELPDGPARRDVEVIRQAAERAAGLTRQLLAFSRKQVIEPRLVDLNVVARQTKQMLRRTLRESVTLEPDLGEIGSVLADPGQLEQVLVNLAVNASDAMPEGGTLTVRTRDVVVDQPLAHRYKGLRIGKYVTLAVEDTGIGMDAATQARIFEPFFTTKEVGKGTGLGLSTVYGIVKQWGGYIAVESAPGAGATFTVYLPRHEGQATAESTAEARLPTGTETVLVVEDETAVRNSIRRILTRQGYMVLEARHGTDALRVFDAAQRRVDLVVTDLMMPEMGGRQLMAELGARPAAPRILVISGYDEQVTLKGERLPAGTRFLEKPFTVPGLLQSVRAALDAGGEPAPR
jgi:two-component system cell cycle sensor histidine kinase/response regulator CckA